MIPWKEIVICIFKKSSQESIICWLNYEFIPFIKVKMIFTSPSSLVPPPQPPPPQAHWENREKTLKWEVSKKGSLRKKISLSPQQQKPVLLFFFGNYWHTSFRKGILHQNKALVRYIFWGFFWERPILPLLKSRGKKMDIFLFNSLRAQSGSKIQYPQVKLANVCGKKSKTKFFLHWKVNLDYG